ncbi:hypothetical protein [uncultured Dysosmobacter sp.]|uniref:hypothetical protein n=1 Tax=uncultured Dysosmobacter sp. TaxID=2591384 RepID=UPI00261E08C3|nr:hypothetical protein [uncultured Dysosmobacter sp.]
MGNALSMLEDLATKLCRDWQKFDPEQILFREQYERLFQDVCSRLDTETRNTVIAMLDARLCGLEGEKEFLFRLGLQIGLELGGLDILEKIC